MSVDLIVYLSRKAMPRPSEWARAITAAGFPATLDSDFDVDELSGFLPCRYDGANSGFEYSAGPVEPEDDLELPRGVDFSVTLSTHSDMRELASSVVCASVLCVLSGGILVDPQADVTVSAEDALTWAREMLTEIDA